MARGWESKSVEFQIESAQQDDRVSQTGCGQLPPGEARRRMLELDRKRLLQDLNAARHPRHQQMLRQALAHVEHQLASLDDNPVC
ncbi:MAG: hypothetical protein NZV14_03940 [Bryobacteraceae bacterium]|nr:hypothetical protein [Bryobacteraceae bacterium]MDW8377283.1 hypothetical protein [Bryobacterales bacterium]